MKGRKPKPTALHTLHGNPSHLKPGVLEGKRAVEPPADDTMDPPASLTPSQRVIWLDAIQSAPPGILRRIDMASLKVWVVACDLHGQACEMQSKVGLLVHAQQTKRDEDGTPLPNHSPLVQSPFLAIINRQGQMMLRAAEQMGFTPTSRPRIYGSSPMPVTPPSHAGAASGISLEDYLASAPPSPVH